MPLFRNQTCFWARRDQEKYLRPSGEWVTAKKEGLRNSVVEVVTVCTLKQVKIDWHGEK